MKPCKKCGVVKPLSDFRFARKSPDSLAHTCRACMGEKRIAQQAMEKIYAAQQQERMVEVRCAYGVPYVTPDHDFLLDLHEVLIEAMFLRGRKSPFDHLQFIETGRGWDTFETDL